MKYFNTSILLLVDMHICSDQLFSSYKNFSGILWFKWIKMKKRSRIVFKNTQVEPLGKSKNEFKSAA